MKTIALKNLGGLGNMMHRYAYARALAEQNGWVLKTEPWVGEKIFTLGHDGPGAFYPYHGIDGTEDIVIDGYRQTQADLIYTRRDCRRWFKIRPEIAEQLDMKCQPKPHAHLRRGDYHRSGYPTVSRESVIRAACEFGISGPIHFVSDADPTIRSDFPPEMEMWIQDFYDMVEAPVLFRGNSTFSWWAATLGHGRVLSPIITGLEGGVEHDDVKYVEGNWPACADLPGIVSDLHLPD